MRAIFVRDMRLAFRRRADTAAALFFFVIVASLFPLGVGPEPALLRTMAAGVVWVAALLASMLSLGRLFADDHAVFMNDQIDWRVLAALCTKADQEAVSAADYR